MNEPKKWYSHQLLSYLHKVARFSDLAKHLEIYNLTGQFLLMGKLSKWLNIEQTTEPSGHTDLGQGGLIDHEHGQMSGGIPITYVV